LITCPLCQSSAKDYASDRHRRFFECDACSLVFVARDSLLSEKEEFARYDLHNNAEEDVRYKEYLDQVVTEMLPFINRGELALDFGCGRTELLSKLIREQGLDCLSYDLYFFPREEIWKESFDVIVMCEVIEHLRNPLETVKKLAQKLRPGGRLFIKTKFLPEKKESFANWYYKNDLTHVEFFSARSMKKISELCGLNDPVYMGHDVTMLRASR
jgi:SAM-dependent methyltransferase